jgi:hypothetical protein
MPLRLGPVLASDLVGEGMTKPVGEALVLVDVTHPLPERPYAERGRRVSPRPGGAVIPPGPVPRRLTVGDEVIDHVGEDGNFPRPFARRDDE